MATEISKEESEVSQQKLFSDMNVNLVGDSPGLPEDIGACQ